MGWGRTGLGWAGREVTDLERSGKKIHYVRSSWYVHLNLCPSQLVLLPKQSDIDAKYEGPGGYSVSPTKTLPLHSVRWLGGKNIQALRGGEITSTSNDPH